MARRFRIYGKKRGDRRTGSQRLGSLGEMLFHVAILLLGVASFYLLLTRLIWPEWKANRHFVEHECIVEELIVSGGEDDVDAEGAQLYRPYVLVQYEYEGRTLREWATYEVQNTAFYEEEEAKKIIGQFKLGGRYRCWYDPADPTAVVLVRGYSWWIWLLLIVPASFVVMGTVGMVRAALHSGASAERRSALAGKASQIDLFDDRVARGLDYPTVPPLAHIVDSPGTHLTFRLPVDASASWKFGIMWVACVAWNLIVASLMIVCIRNFLADYADWFSLVALLPFLAGGIVILVYCLRHSLRTAALGTTGVEISAIPIEPGKKYELYFFQSGHTTLNDFRLVLACDERATFRQGTDTRSESVRTYEKAIFECAAVEVGPDKSFEYTCQFELPPGVMHSFRSPHNEVQWKLVVEADAGRRGRYLRRFPIVVYPCLHGGEN